MASTDKVRALIARLEQLEAPTGDTAAAALLLMLTLQRDTILRLVPADPAELDVLLLQGAAWALQLRSDTALRFELLSEAPIGAEPDLPEPDDAEEVAP